ncbi:carboxymuconolactone decarboxylase family protein [Oceanicola sp. 502str15]|uniref:carboxymuconolactone decarboxylase family protein n=1 Tax=Oceanicola sp. 502str15 TaxID=2696061 RepID=UPI0020955FCF|nr:carboxymuconolactone decarboxylase family protein [Oceanicola sp. 502str15]MCO6383173.1 carboxymuconolactone decarboxylase family protein [Oceanicola sp. 502str15]
MATVPLLADEELSPRAAAVFAEIRAARGTDFVNNFWRALAHDEEALEETWNKLSVLMGPGALDPLVKEMIYVAVSTANGCSYCVHSHTAAARAKGMSGEMHAELVRVIGAAMMTNGMVTAMQVPVDEVFDV